MTETFAVDSEEAMRALGASLAARWREGDVVFLEGPLGAGKTTFVRGLVAGLGHEEIVRSPTFNLIQTFETNPPIMHADLYRVAGWEGIGIEEYFDTHLCLIEWADRARGALPEGAVWHVSIRFEGEGRTVEVTPPAV
jgi:tRNA threonylcarbamoyladenosine biosynthesis protein TsaE